MKMESGRGVQVVKINKDHTYELDEQALRGILLRDDIKDCPVVVVSVAGAYRGGKSFLLDFFLRYLYFKYANGVETAQDMEWLGDEDEPLRGFSWRGGSERDTTGLLLWSQPILATLSNGEKVAVLVMDTQGTFDSGSTVRDCSTIFALSTLLSSVQIYNLSQNIKEDNLQHLQLFAEYGRLVSTGDQKPFQKLKFLVRDWNYYYEHPFGTKGGKQLLQKRFEVKDDQDSELREIRQRILTCFEDVTCFLMPFPGLTVASDPNFSGKLTDIRAEFKQSLQELVPSIFQPQNLIAKEINGQKIKAGELFYFFKTYLSEFNSDKLPTPVTITRAMTKAGTLSAMEQARANYLKEMEYVCGGTRPSVTPTTLQEAHERIGDLSLQLLKTALENVIGQQKIENSYFEQLKQEFDRKLLDYKSLNSAKIITATAKSKAKYEESIRSIDKEAQICLHQQDLKEIHNKAFKSAMKIFDTSRIPPQNVEDAERNALLNYFAERLNQLKSMNDTNNKTAMIETREDYYIFMDTCCGAQPCLNRRYLELKHEEGLTRALDIFHNKRSRDKRHQNDSYVSELRKDIDEHFGRLQTINDENNKAALQDAMSCYNTSMGTLIHPQMPCLHPEDFNQEHSDARDIALNEFHSRMTQGHTVDEDDEYLQKLTQFLSGRYEELFNLNETHNASAVEAAVAEYDAAMTALCGPGRQRFSDEQFTAGHTFALNNGALRVFYDKRRAGPEHNADRYRENLMQIIDEHFTHHRQINDNNPEPQQVDEKANELSFMESALIVAGSAAAAAGVVAVMVSTGGLAAVAGGGAAAAGAGVAAEGVVVVASTAATVAGTVTASALKIYNLIRIL